MENLYKGEIGRLDFFKNLIGYCFINWIWSVLVTIASTALSPFFIILYIPAIGIWLLILFNYKKRGMNIFKNEIISWILAIIITCFGFLYGIWQLAYCIFSNLYTYGKIAELPFFATNENALLVYSYIGNIGIVIFILLLIYLFVPGRKNNND